MPKEGFYSITVDEETHQRILKLINKNNKELKSGSGVVAIAVKKFKRAA